MMDKVVGKQFSAGLDYLYSDFILSQEKHCQHFTALNEVRAN